MDMAGTLLGREFRQPVYQNRSRRSRSIEELPRSSRLRVSGSAAPPANPQAGDHLALRELEALAGALATVLLAFLHAAIAGEVAGVAELFGHAAARFLLAGGRGTEHFLQGAGHALTDGARLPGEAAAVDVDENVEAIAHVGGLQRRHHCAAVLVLGEVVFEPAIVDDDLAGAVGQAHTRHSRLAPAGAPVEMLLPFRFRHGRYSL